MLGAWYGAQGSEPDFRGNQCYARKAGLSHKGLDDNEDWCEYCHQPITATPPTGVPASASEARSTHAEVFDHHYVFTLSGRCAKKGCGKFREQHAEYRVGGDPDECTVDHRSIKPYTKCPICQMYVEPKEATGTYPDTYSGARGKESIAGRGRMPVTDRDLSRWESLRKAWIGGYYHS